MAETKGNNKGCGFLLLGLGTIAVLRFIDEHIYQITIACAIISGILIVICSLLLWFNRSDTPDLSDEQRHNYNSYNTHEDPSDDSTGEPYEYSSNPLQQAYDIFGIAPDASDADVKAAYRRLAREYHPDRYSTLAPDMQQLASERFKQINAARDVIWEARGWNRN